MLELDLVVSRYIKEKVNGWSLIQCRDFYDQVLTKETPDLYRLVISREMKESKNDPFISDLIKFTQKA